MANKPVLGFSQIRFYNVVRKFLGNNIIKTLSVESTTSVTSS